ncbi:MAG: Hsp70 family protein [Deltaproteobacteria bacterium]|nr:Hsp70 family protein [Deltaproteobacteria bacterium]
MGVAVGIDLGTTNSCVAIVQGDQAKIIESVYGDRIHPSVISFHPNGETIAGSRAKERLAIDPLNTVYSFKRLLGQDLSSPEIKHLLESLPYDVFEKNGIPVLKTRDREATLPEVSALMLRYLREMASETYGVDIREAIITVPANFTDVQRASTKIAGRIAGFNVLRILNEPTAAALAYGFGGEKEERIAVYDFGGGTFDITIIELLDDIFEVLSTAGDNFLGGDDLDDKLVHEMLIQFNKKHKIDLHEDPVAMQRIRSVAERAKCQLSSIDEVNATLREISTDKRGRKIDFTFSITRTRFNELIAPLVERTLATCEEALQLAKLAPEDLDNVVLVGGSTRVPLVRQQVAEFFKKQPRIEVNPDEVVAIGAAINAFSLTQESLDPSILPIKKSLPITDPFEKMPSAAKQPMRNTGGLSKAVRDSKMPPPPKKRTESPKFNDPFAKSSSPFALDNPFAKPLTKIELETKKTIVGVSGIKKPDSLFKSDLPTTVSRTDLNDDTWEVPSEISNDDIDLPTPIDGNVDLPAPAGDAGLPSPVSKSDFISSINADNNFDEIDLPASVDGEVDLPAPVDSEIDLPDIHDGEIDLLGNANVISDLLTPVENSQYSTSQEDEISDYLLDEDVSEISQETSFDNVNIDFSASNTFTNSDLPEPDDTEEIEDLDDMIINQTRDDSFGSIDLQPGNFADDENEILTPPSYNMDEDVFASPKVSSNHHPLDEVVGEDGKEAVTETHEAFTVPVNKMAPAVLLDVTPRGLGVATAGGYCDVIIERNAAIPIEQSRHFSTSRDNQTTVMVDVYQGESRRTAENTKLGSIELSNIRQAPRGDVSIMVTFEIDTDGILNVKAINEETKETHSTTIKLSGGLEDEQVSALVEKYAKK